MESEYNSFVGKFVKKDEPDFGKAGPSRVPTYSERIGKVIVEEFELPSCYGTGSGFAPQNVSDESSDSSDDDEIAHGIAHHEKRLLRYEARLKRWNKRNPGHGGSFPSRELHFSDESSSVASSSDDTWVTDDSADENTASVDPAFDRQRLQQRYSSALRRARMRRSRPRSYAHLSGWPTARSGLLGTERIFVQLARCRRLTSPSALLDTLSPGHVDLPVILPPFLTLSATPLEVLVATHMSPTVIAGLWTVERIITWLLRSLIAHQTSPRHLALLLEYLWTLLDKATVKSLSPLRRVSQFLRPYMV